MSNFNGNTGFESGLDNGTADIFVNSVKINDISTPGLPLKVDANKEIYSTTLDISDTSGLQAALDATITNPYVGVLQASDFRSDNIPSYDATVQALVASNATLVDKTQNITAIGVNTDISNGFARYQGFVYDTPTANNHLTPKVYVDTKISKTDTADQSIVSNLNLSTPASGLTVSGVSGQGSDISLTGLAGELNDGIQGFTFTIDDNIVVNRVKVRNEARNGNSSGFIGYWFRDPPSTTWNLVTSGSLQSGSVGTDGNFRWTENGYPRTLLENNGRIHAFVLDMGVGGRLSADPPSTLTYEAGINIIGRCYEAVPNLGTFPNIQTTDGYAPVCSFEYVKNTPTYDKILNCGSINNKNGTIINVRDPTNPQDVATKKFVDDSISGVLVNVDDKISKTDVAAQSMASTLQITNNTPSADPATGALRIQGGMGIIGKIFSADDISTEGDLNVDGEINVKNGGVLIYQTGLVGIAPSREGCLHIVCNDGEGPLTVEERSGGGGRARIQLRPIVTGTQGAITMYGITTDTRCNMFLYDTTGATELGRLQINLLNGGAQENQIEITTAQTTIKKDLVVSGDIGRVAQKVPNAFVENLVINTIDDSSFGLTGGTTDVKYNPLTGKLSYGVKSHAYINLVDNLVTTSIVAANTSYTMGGIHSTGSIQDFTSTTAGVLTYTGSDSRTCQMDCNWDWSTEEKSNDLYDVAVYVDDVEQACKMESRLSNSNAYPRSAGLTFITNLTTNQTVQVKIRGNSANKTILISQLNLTITEL
jgi:hypothetical protein